MGCKPIRIETAKSVNVTKTNTLHQFDTADIIGLPSPVGKVPIIFYVRDNAYDSHKGIIYGEDKDSVCYMYPEVEHAEWCKQPYDIPFDAIEPWDNGVERGLRRKFGILELWASVWRKWHNGEVMYRPSLKIQGCSNTDEGYPYKTEQKPSTTQRPSVLPVTKKAKTTRPGCGCGKG